MIDWKAAARHFWHGRKLAREQEIRLKQLLWTEWQRRETLSNTLMDFLLDIAYDEDDTDCTYCNVCRRSLIEENGHHRTCLYVRAMESIEASCRPVEEEN